MSAVVTLREVHASDIEVFYRHQADDEAATMAAVPSRDRDSHAAHWAKILGDATILARSVMLDDDVAGNVVSWRDGERRLVGYWIGRDHWGRGIATDALRLFVGELDTRPLYAKVAVSNVGSIRVLEKCGFERLGGITADAGDVPELLMVIEM